MAGNNLIARGKAMVQALAVKARGGSGAGPSAEYMRNGQSSPFLMGWRPALRDGRDEVRQSYTMAAARAIDGIHNSGWLAGGIRQAIHGIVGAGLRLNCRPDTTVIKFKGLTDEEGRPIDADGWARYVERRWEVWSNSPRECDAVGRQTVSQIVAAALMQYFRTGEMLATLPYRYDPSVAVSGTKVQLLQSHRLSQRTDPLHRMIQGVSMDANGVPISYLFEFREIEGTIRYQEVAARDGAGRPQVIHVYEGGPGECRGITPLVAVLKIIRQYDQLSDATLTAALIQTIFAATVESDVPTGDFLQSLQSGAEQGLGGSLDAFLSATMGWNSNVKFDMGQHGKINHLFPGEKMKFNKSEHPNGTYQPFAKFLLLELAKCIGTTYPQLSGDYEGATYSSSLMEGAENWQIVLSRRRNLATPFIQPIYEAWLEEEIETGRVKFPGGLSFFMAQRAAACRSDWRGPPRPRADELKTARTHQIYDQMGVLPEESIANDLGVDIEDVYEARARARTIREKNGIFIVPSPAMNGIPGAPPDDPEDDGSDLAKDDVTLKPPPGK